MSQRNGDKARFNRAQQKRQLNKQRTRALRQTLELNKTEQPEVEVTDGQANSKTTDANNA